MGQVSCAGSVVHVPMMLMHRRRGLASPGFHVMASGRLVTLRLAVMASGGVMPYRVATARVPSHHLAPTVMLHRDHLVMRRRVVDHMVVRAGGGGFGGGQGQDARRGGQGHQERLHAGFLFPSGRVLRRPLTIPLEQSEPETRVNGRRPAPCEAARSNLTTKLSGVLASLVY